MRVLVVEDTVDIAEAVVMRLEKVGHAVDWERDGLTAAELLEVQPYDLVILDLTLPGQDGIAVLKGMRSRKLATPVLVLTARSAVDERIGALDLGADDYLIKPFDYGELEARARALLRRSAGQPDNLLRVGPLVIDRAGRVATVADRPLNLTRRELTVLEILAARPERIVPKEELVEQLFNFDQEASPNAVEQFVARLRRKLGDAPIEIRTLRGLGYQLAAL
ncbi:response regulator transcription factor [Bradyrhizobium sp. ISRA443]|uniref:response regulator transcription factor n=1 Tax=unclassified Bradyrhizobium TaxID=2631580 RepID=UPI0024797D80|nr:MULTISPECIES: response regulator transcription factor [unclassified Bradyrhizobium]WGR94339.1 response regulator transcription factor [Bradyrhizobium sp. ISRA435]WGR99054.1 response regulator transcription factor [Bradyrhizobium sp. ISRA436]WGS05945.1 response regulator transcription factor [Bradyrhizobium sp. ISRA437]WGS12831.1 response regulator transcription factor [Bradyrhizobium sp. ISRA443]